MLMVHQATAGTVHCTQGSFYYNRAFWGSSRLLPELKDYSSRDSTGLGETHGPLSTKIDT